MGRYLDLIAVTASCEISEISEVIAKPGRINSHNSLISQPEPPAGSPFRAVLRELEGRCPDWVEAGRWQQAVADGQRFLSQWGEQAQQLGWTAKDLFGLHQPPENPPPSYRRLSRYDATGLLWLLDGREVTALTGDTAAIRWESGSVTLYRRHNKPALGPLGDSLDDLR